MQRLGVLWMVCCAAVAFAQGAAAETQKIEYLIAQIQFLQGADFIRNGASYPANAAADHLRTKWHAAGSRVTTAEDFIRLCATASSVSGIPYSIHLADGRTIASADFLRQKLSEYDVATMHPRPRSSAPSQ